MPRATRQRLLDAAVELLIDEGGAGLTTGRLTEQAGVVQSAFYNHFASVDECKQAALREVRSRVMTTADVIFGGLQGPGNTGTGDAGGHLTQIFLRAEATPPPFQLVVQRHHQPDVAATINDVLDTLRAKLTETIMRNAPRSSGLTEAEAATAARLVVGVFLAGLEHVLDGGAPVPTASFCAAFMTGGVSGIRHRDR